MAIRTALLTNFVPPYRLKLLSALQDRVGELKIFVSTQMEADRPWAPDLGTLDVVQQKTKTFERTRVHPNGCSHRFFIHFPYDTIARLWRFAPQIIVSSELGLRSLQAAIYRKLVPSSRLIIWATLSEETEKGWGILRQMLRRTILSTADAVMCNGSSGARYINSFGFPANRIFLLNQPVDLELFASLPADRTPDRARRLVFSGRLIAAKAVVELQQTLSNWAIAHPDQPLEMVWIGDGELRPQLEQAKLPPNLSQVFYGNQPYTALPELYRNCGVLVLPSLMDEWGLVVNEAMASGMLVMGSIYSQASIEMIRDGENGWLIDPLNPESIEDVLDELFATPLGELSEMRVLARKRAERITPDGAADHLLTAITQVLSDKENRTSIRRRSKTIAAAIPARSATPFDTAQ